MLVLSPDDISKEKVAEIKRQFVDLNMTNLTEGESRILQPLIKKLLKDLKYSS